MIDNENGLLVAAYQTTREAYHLPTLAGDDPINDVVFVICKNGEPVAAVQHHNDEEDAQLWGVIASMGLMNCVSDALVDSVRNLLDADEGEVWSVLDQEEAEKDLQMHFEFDDSGVEAAKEQAQFEKDHAQGSQ